MDSNRTEDFFAGLYEHREAKWAILGTAIFMTPINTCLLYCIIWYERYGIWGLCYDFKNIFAELFGE
jgi:hypothetical protein